MFSCWSVPRSVEMLADATAGRPISAGFAPESGLDGPEAANFPGSRDQFPEVSGLVFGVLIEENIENVLVFLWHYDAF